MAESEDERILRDAWDTVYANCYSKTHMPYRVDILIGHEYSSFEGRTEAEVWSAARKFTEDRHATCGKIEQDIEWLRATSHITGDVSYNRILSMLESALDAAKKGLKA